VVFQHSEGEIGYFC